MKFSFVIKCVENKDIKVPGGEIERDAKVPRGEIEREVEVLIG